VALFPTTISYHFDSSSFSLAAKSPTCCSSCKILATFNSSARVRVVTTPIQKAHNATIPLMHHTPFISWSYDTTQQTGGRRHWYYNAHFYAHFYIKQNRIINTLQNYNYTQLHENNKYNAQVVINQFPHDPLHHCQYWPRIVPGSLVSPC